MTRLAYALLVGLVGVAVVHIAILFLMPWLSDRDAWAALERAGEHHRLVSLGEGGVAIDGADPQFEQVACRFDIAETVTHVRAAGRLPFWSVSVFDEAGRNLYSFNDRTAVEGALDLVVATPAQMIDLRKSPPEAFADSVFVESGAEEGMIVIRAFVPDESWRPRVGAWLGGASCAPA